MSKRLIAKARFIPRRMTFVEWEAENPVLLAGEHGFVTDGKDGEQEKIGDGITPWNQLEWWKGLSAYEIAVKNGFDGTVQEWLASLKGEKGDSVDLSNYYTKQEIAKIDQNTNEEIANLQEKLMGKIRDLNTYLLDNYYTRQETDEQIKDIHDLQNTFDADLANLYNKKTDKEYVDSLVGDIETLLGGI